MDFIGYDFDKTVYQGDSSTHFTLWCLARYPKTWLRLPEMGWYSLLFALKLCPKTRFKSHLFSYLRHVPAIDQAVEAFWREKSKRLKSWYLAKDHSRDVIVSASPEFLLEPICRQLQVFQLIGTRMDKTAGKITGENCWGAEKVKRLKAWRPDCRLLEFYSDSRSDDPLAQLADQAFLVTGDQLQPW
ncbi:MAG: phosphoserine phosphatase [Clostridiaceae bacterium]|jgi:phosphatidylglycerophosphatase C|nr:phosphoserine phosphatase [Clostridiaceae bacterium]